MHKSVVPSSLVAFLLTLNWSNKDCCKASASLRGGTAVHVVKKPVDVFCHLDEGLYRNAFKNPSTPWQLHVSFSFPPIFWESFLRIVSFLFSVCLKKNIKYAQVLLGFRKFSKLCSFLWLRLIVGRIFTHPWNLQTHMRKSVCPALLFEGFFEVFWQRSNQSLEILQAECVGAVLAFLVWCCWFIS